MAGVVALQRPSGALIADPHGLFKLVAVSNAGQDQQASGDQLVAEMPAGVGVPGAGENPGLLGAEVVATVGEVGQLVEQRLERRVLGEEQGGAVKLGGTRLVGGRQPASGPSLRLAGT